MLKLLVLIALAGILLAGCSSDGDGNNDAANGSTSKAEATARSFGGTTPIGTPATSGRYTAAAVWDALAGDNPPRDLLEKLTQCQMPNTDCVVQVMQGAGASNEAIAFFKETGWFLVRFREMGSLDLGRIFLPWRANAFYQYYVMNGQPALVSPEDEGGKLSFASEPNYQRLTDAVAVAGIPPSPVSLWISAETNGYESTTNLPNGGKRFVFQYNVVNVCHACGFGYRERVGLDFDSSGRYVGPSLIGLCRSADVQVDLSGVPACPATSP